MSEPRVKIVEKVDHSEYFYSKLPSVWPDKPLAKGFCDVLANSIQKFSDTVYAWGNGVSISNAEGKNLEEIWGELFDEKRQGRDDSKYRSAILSKILSLYDGGTNGDVVKFAKLITLAPYAYCYNYRNTRFCSLYIEGSSVTSTIEIDINKAVTSGGRVDIFFDDTGMVFMPAVSVLPEAQNLLGSRLDGNILAELNAINPDGSQSGITLDSSGSTYYEASLRQENMFFGSIKDDGTLPGYDVDVMVGIDISGFFDIQAIVDTGAGTEIRDIEIMSPLFDAPQENDVDFATFFAMNAGSVRNLVEL